MKEPPKTKEEWEELQQKEKRREERWAAGRIGLGMGCIGVLPVALLTVTILLILQAFTNSMFYGDFFREPPGLGGLTCMGLTFGLPVLSMVICWSVAALRQTKQMDVVKDDNPFRKGW